MPEANSPSPSSSARVRTDGSVPADEVPADGTEPAPGRKPEASNAAHEPNPAAGQSESAGGSEAAGQAESAGQSQTAGHGETAGQGDGPHEDAHRDEFEDEDERPALTPRQARRIRIVLSAVVMLAVAVALVIRLGSAPSVLTVGFYGLALILSGTAIALSRLGRTRVATAVLALGFALVVFGEWLLGFSGGP
ncbi:hypothetical protein [Streptomyces sp. 891-h]|uniref:hypothetical protein n=1 Tax=Streptomyces sp. 891-h TaxID=2720714 RepID=UPI001FA946E6|nr:hypothetical protein [Streptomyces sp. 891-h]UNZ16563.1 hypothetical protein HC362_05220 [Streptomyces sp. 891-h]